MREAKAERKKVQTQMSVPSDGSAIPVEPTSILPSLVPAITPTITGKSSTLYLCTKILSYLMF